MTTAIQKQDQAAAIEQVVVGGDLSPLNAAQRVAYYNQVCESVGLNPFTRPFDYIKLNGKLTLYAKRDAADQLRKLNVISLGKPRLEYVDDLIIVWVDATDRLGRTDSDCGAVSIKGLAGEAKANAILKAITKAKRRVTLSISGLGWLDETEVDSIAGAQRIVDTATGEIVTISPAKAQKQAQDASNGPAASGIDADVDFGMGQDNPFDNQPAPRGTPISPSTRKRLHAVGTDLYGDGWDDKRHELVGKVSKGAVASSNELTENEARQLIAGMEAKLAQRQQPDAQLQEAVAA